MKEPDSLDALLHEWKSPEPTAELDQRVMSAYRSAVRPPRFSPLVWRRFWTMRVSVPAPVLVAAALAIFALFFWLRPSAAPAASPETSGVVTRLNATGFQPLPNGEARVVPAVEIHEMKKNAFVFVSLTAFAAVLQADPQHILHASFPDGTGLEIFTEATGSSQIDSEGEMGIGPGVGSQDLVNRVVRDRANNILFVYNLEASRGTSPDTVKIRIEPISAASEAGMLKYEASHGRPFPGAHLPTVAGVREFPAVKIGEAVTLDILYNPSTGEKIYDVLRPITSSSPVMSVTSVVAPETISLKQIAIRVNGRAMSAPASFLIGSAVRIDIPHLRHLCGGGLRSTPGLSRSWVCRDRSRRWEDAELGDGPRSRGDYVQH